MIEQVNIISNNHTLLGHLYYNKISNKKKSKQIQTIYLHLQLGIGVQEPSF